MNLLFKAFVALSCLIAVNASPIVVVDGNDSNPNFRLPKHINPSHYDIVLTLQDFDGAKDPSNFVGEVWLTFTVNEPTSNVTLHSYKDFTIADGDIKLYDITPESTTTSTTDATTTTTGATTTTTEATTTTTEATTTTTEATTTTTEATTTTTEATTTTTVTTTTTAETAPPVNSDPPPEGGDKGDGSEGGEGSRSANPQSKDGTLPTGDGDFAIINTQFESETSIFTIYLDSDVPLETEKVYQLYIKYTGVIRDDMHGFYKSSYQDDSKKKWILTTQFESIDARSAFPCLDEPEFKATYNLQVKIPKATKDKGYHVLFNTPLVSDSKEDGDLVVYEFEQTPVPISSYLVAFIVSDFKASSVTTFTTWDEDGNKVQKPYRTFGQKKFIDAGDWQLSQIAGTAILQHLTEKLKIGYPYQKMDQVGIPDFSAGAMENWGLTTYRERMLFFNEDTGSVSTMQSIICVTVHELAHQWFGDLVTLHFWDDIWLNEGFADFFEYHGAAEINTGDYTTGFNLLKQFVVDEVQGAAFETDGLTSSRPLTSKITSLNDIDANFDNIAYSKGGSVIRMWMHILGEDIFYNGLHRYLTDHAGRNGHPEELLQAFTDAVNTAEPDERPLLHEDPNVVFKEWHTLAGYPVLNVVWEKNTTYNISQERFLWKEDKTRANDQFWHIPITYSTHENPQFNNTQPQAWLEKDETGTLELTDHKERPTWIVVNNQETGYYRVNYDSSNWEALLKQLSEDHLAIDEINRAQIIDDMLSLSRSTVKDYVSYDDALRMTKYLEKETSYYPWKAALTAFNFLNTKLANEAEYKYFTGHVLKVVRPVFENLTLTVKDDDDFMTRLNRMQIASWACKLGDDDCVKQAKDAFSAASGEKPKKIHPDVRSTVYCTAIRNGGEEEWNAVWNLYTQATDNVEQTLYLSVLGCSKNEKILNDYLAKTITINPKDPNIRQQDFSAVFQSVYNGNAENVGIALKFLTANYENIAQSYAGLNPLGGLLTGIAAKLSTEADSKTMKELQTKIGESTIQAVQNAKSSAQLAVDIVASNIKWVEAKKGSIDKWLKNEYEEEGGGGGGAGQISFNIFLAISCITLLFSYQ